MNTFLFTMAVVYFLLNMIEMKAFTVTSPLVFNAIGWLSLAMVLSAEVFK